MPVSSSPPSSSRHRLRSVPALVLLAVVVAALPGTAWPAGKTQPVRPDPAEIVVKIQAVRNPPNYHQPWQNLGRQTTNGSGFIIPGNRILTNAHVVSNSVFIDVRRAGETEKVAARVAFFDHHSDLAILEVDNPEFFSGVETIPFGSLPFVRDKVAAYGFPDGGDKMSITEGVVSRIEHINYAYSGAFLLACQIDASINSGNSGGPVFIGEEIIGVAFQGMGFNYDNIAYMIPTPVVERFLRDVEDGRVDGVPDLGVIMQKLESPYLRDYYRLKQDEHGPLVNRVPPGSPSENILRRGDVILSVEGKEVAYDGTVEFRKGQRTFFGYLVQNRQIGETVTLAIKRDGVSREVRITLTEKIGFAHLVPLFYEVKPRYFILGGMVFQPLSLNYLHAFGGGLGWFQSAPVELVNTYFNGKLEARGREVVLLSQVLADQANVGYHELANNIIAKVNEVEVENFNHFIRLVEEEKGPFLHLVSSQGTHVALKREDVAASTARIITRYSIPADRYLVEP
jgi:S1-C subfamily serine protease